MTAAIVTQAAPRLRRRPGLVRHHAWSIVVCLLCLVLVLWRQQQVGFLNSDGIYGVTSSLMNIALLAIAQGIIVVSGGIDLSIGSLMVLINCVSAKYMEGTGLGGAIGVAVLSILLAVVLSTFVGWIITTSKIPDIIVTLAMSFIWAGVALWILPSPGGEANKTLRKIVVFARFDQSYRWLPSVAWILAALLLVWWPIRRSRLGLAIYAIGSNRNAAFLSGVDVPRTRVAAYGLAGLFAGFAGVVMTCFLNSAEPRATIGNDATLNSVAIVVLAGVSLTGGIGALWVTAIAAICIKLIPDIILGLSLDPSYADLVKGAVLVIVVMIGGLLRMQKVAS